MRKNVGDLAKKAHDLLEAETLTFVQDRLNISMQCNDDRVFQLGFQLRMSYMYIDSSFSLFGQISKCQEFKLSNC